MTSKLPYFNLDQKRHQHWVLCLEIWFKANLLRHPILLHTFYKYYYIVCFMGFWGLGGGKVSQNTSFRVFQKMFLLQSNILRLCFRD